MDFPLHPRFRLHRAGGITVLTVLDPEIAPEARGTLHAAAEELAAAPEPQHLVRATTLDVLRPSI